MRKSIKKIGAVLLAAILVCGTLSACGKEDSSNSSKNADGKIVISLWSTYGTYGTKYMEELIDKFNDSQDKYFVEGSAGYDAASIRTKMQTSKQSTYPSLICGTSTTMASYAKASYVKPLQDFIEKDSEDWTANMFPGVRRCYSDLDGRLIGNPTGVSCNGYIINVDILNQLGYKVEDLTSFEKIAQIAKEAVSKKVCKYGISFASGVDLVDMVTMQGGMFVDADNGYSGEATKSTLMEGVAYDAITKASTILADLFASGTALDFGYGSDCTAIFNANDLLFWKCTNSSTHNIYESGTKINWSFIPSVGVDENAKYKNAALSEGTGIFICNTGDEEEMQGAYEFIKFIAKPENQVEFEKGIGYVPYTTEAADLYEEWSNVNFPSATGIIEKLKTSPADLALPFVDIGGEINTAMTDLLGNIAVYPDADLSSYIQEASETIDIGLKVYSSRK